MKVLIKGQAFDFDLTAMSNREGMAIERVTGMTYSQWSEAVRSGSMLALTALVWVLERRTRPDLRFDDVEFSLDDIDVQEDGPDASDPAEASSETG